MPTGRPADETNWTSKYKDCPYTPLFPFGFGLSYSKFTYSDVKLSKTQAKTGEKVTLTVEVNNESDVEGEEVVQLYFKDKICKILTPIRTLLDFKRVYVPANESRTVEFEISTEKLGYYNQDCKYVVDAGEFEFYVSGDGKNFKTAELLVKECYT